MQIDSEERQRLSAAAAIQSKVKSLAMQMGMEVLDCMWNMRQGMNHVGPHRLDIRSAHQDTKIYFSDLELISYEQDSVDTDDRLRILIVKLCEDESILPMELLYKTQHAMLGT
jgi:hypothetical protein